MLHGPAGHGQEPPPDLDAARRILQEAEDEARRDAARREADTLEILSYQFRLYPTPPTVPLADLVPGRGGPDGLQDVVCGRTDLALKIWDHGSQDGDTITLAVGDDVLLSNFNLDACGGEEPFAPRCHFPLRGTGRRGLRVRVLAHNEGSSPPNTASIKVDGDCHPARQTYSLAEGEEGVFWITAEHPSPVVPRTQGPARFCSADIWLELLSIGPDGHIYYRAIVGGADPGQTVSFRVAGLARGIPFEDSVSWSVDTNSLGMAVANGVLPPLPPPIHPRLPDYCFADVPIGDELAYEWEDVAANYDFFSPELDELKKGTDASGAVASSATASETIVRRLDGLLAGSETIAPAGTSCTEWEEVEREPVQLTEVCYQNPRRCRQAAVSDFERAFRFWFECTGNRLRTRVAAGRCPNRNEVLDALSDFYDDLDSMRNASGLLGQTIDIVETLCFPGIELYPVDVVCSDRRFGF